jgi:hypothetical protein
MMLRSNYRVQVSRMMTAPFEKMRTVSDGAPNLIPRRCYALAFLLMCNSRRFYTSAHFVLPDANLSLLPPRHPC